LSGGPAQLNMTRYQKMFEAPPFLKSSGGGGKKK
jgi:hypothetical protein